MHAGTGAALRSTCVYFIALPRFLTHTRPPPRKHMHTAREQPVTRQIDESGHTDLHTRILDHSHTPLSPPPEDTEGQIREILVHSEPDNVTLLDPHSSDL